MTNEWFKPVSEDEAVVEVGSITLFINVPKGYEGSISDETLASVEQQAVSQFIAAAERYGVDIGALRILDVETRLGCITIIISLGVVIKVALTTGAAVAALATFLKSYKDIREGLILMAKDVKAVRMFVKGKEYTQTASVYKEALTKTDNKEQLNKDVDTAIRELQQRMAKRTLN